MIAACKNLVFTDVEEYIGVSFNSGDLADNSLELGWTSGRIKQIQLIGVNLGYNLLCFGFDNVGGLIGRLRFT